MPRIEIVDGPGKMDLMLALFDLMPNGVFRSVNFKVKEDCGEDYGTLSNSYEAVISGCARVAGPEVWMVTGEIKITNLWRKFKATYSTPKRIGDLEYEI